MKHKLKKVFSSIALLLLLLLLAIAYVPITFGHKIGTNDYSNIIGEANLASTTLVTDIAMLGAHDAFSDEINLLSKPDPGESGVTANKFVNALFKGGMVRVTRAQKNGAGILLKSGVRYFDARVSFVGDKWMTKHGLLSGYLSTYLTDIYDFLNSHPKEFVVFDLQHIYLGEKSAMDFLDYLMTTRINEQTFADFIHYDTSINALADLNYEDVISSERGGIIFLANPGEISNEYKNKIYIRGDGEENLVSIRSKWHDVIKEVDLISKIDLEASYIKNQGLTGMFFVNQAQLTPDYFEYPLETILKWSLLDLAKKSNVTLIKNENFHDWLSVMPIFMVDFANTNYQNFNTLIIEQILEYNKSL